MSYRNQNKTPAPLYPVNKKQNDAPVPEVSEWEIIEFTKEEEVNGKFKGKTFDSKVCINSLQKALEDLVKQNDHLHTMLDSPERKCVEAEAAMKVKEAEMNLTISKLEDNIVSLKESLNSQEGMYKRLQTYNNKLQNELIIAKDARDDAIKQKETAVKEVNILRGELEKLGSDIVRNGVECNRSKLKYFTLERTCSNQRGKILGLQHQLDAANKKLKELKGSSKWYG